MRRRVEVGVLEDMRERGFRKDEPHFSEQRINSQLVSGLHFTHQNMELPSHVYIDDASGGTEVEIAVNYLGKYSRIKQNKLVMHAPMVRVVSKSDDERVDRKASELAQRVWEDIVYRHEFRRLIKLWAYDYVVLGECIARISWDRDRGTLEGVVNKSKDSAGMGYDEGFRLHGTDGGVVGGTYPSDMEPVSNVVGVFSGDLSIERVEPWNLIRPEECKDIKDAEWLCIDRYMHINTVRNWFNNDPDKRAKIFAGGDDAYNSHYMYDLSNGFHQVNRHVRVSELYYRPCSDFPRGYYVYFTNNCILFEGELPLGEFPIVYRGQLSSVGNCRHHSIIRDAKPVQAEINRCVGKAIQHSLTLGDDKIFMPQGSKISDKIQEPGSRVLLYASQLQQQPVVIEGRTGIQHMDHAERFVSLLKDIFDERDPGDQSGGGRGLGQDPMAMLFASYQEQERNSFYGSEFEQFLVKTCEGILKFARSFYTDRQLLSALGDNEYAAVEDFRGHALRDTVEVAPISDSANSVFGKQRAFELALQYASSQLPPKDIGLILQGMPLGNKDVAFQSLNLDHQIADGLLRNLDNGRDVPIDPLGEDLQFMVKTLTTQIKLPGFKQKSWEVRELYKKKLYEYQQIMAEQQSREMELNMKSIPTDGPLVKISGLHVENPAGGSKTTVPARLPLRSLYWLMDRLKQRGISQEQLMGLDMASREQVLRMASQMASGGGTQQLPPAMEGGSLPPAA